MSLNWDSWIERLCLTTIRFLPSSPNPKFRRFSSLKIASHAILTTCIRVSIGYSHVLMVYSINSNLSWRSRSNTYGTFLGIWHLLFYGMDPPSLMLRFSLLTIRHVRNLRKMPAVAKSNSTNISSKDNHLLRMAFIQCLVVGFTTSIYSGFQLYSSSTINERKEHFELNNDSFFTLIFGTVSAIGHTATFFVFTVTSKLFRQQIYCHWQWRWGWLCSLKCEPGSLYTHRSWKELSIKK